VKADTPVDIILCIGYTYVSTCHDGLWAVPRRHLNAWSALVTDDLVTTTQAAELIGKSRSRIHQLVRSGTLNPVPHTAGTGFRFRRADVMAYRAQPRRRGKPQKPIDQVGERQRYRRRKHQGDQATS